MVLSAFGALLICATGEWLREAKEHVKVIVNTSVDSWRAAEVGGPTGPAKTGGGVERGPLPSL